ncbi:MAG: transcription elongation factor GreA [Patescibacteria group bacterium]|nr:transcription elongation factor GreA [Patescibacteria group bacterium]
MDAKKIYLTKEGIAELKKEYQELNSVKRPSVLERMSQARSMGDLSENGEYIAAREELSFIDGRIDELEELLKQAVLIDEGKKSPKSSVSIGSTVTLNTNGKKEIFTVVGEWEADPSAKKISHESPLGKALLDKKVGEIVEVEAPAGKIRYTIIAVN